MKKEPTVYISPSARFRSAGKLRKMRKVDARRAGGSSCKKARSREGRKSDQTSRKIAENGEGEDEVGIREVDSRRRREKET